MHRFMTELLSPSQIGPASTRMSAAKHALLNRRPLVARPAMLGHVGPHAGRDVVVDEPEPVGDDSVTLHQRTARIDQRPACWTLRAIA